MAKKRTTTAATRLPATPEREGRGFVTLLLEALEPDAAEDDVEAHVAQDFGHEVAQVPARDEAEDKQDEGAEDHGDGRGDPVHHGGEYARDDGQVQDLEADAQDGHHEGQEDDRAEDARHVEGLEDRLELHAIHEPVHPRGDGEIGGDALREPGKEVAHDEDCDGRDEVGQEAQDLAEHGLERIHEGVELEGLEEGQEREEDDEVEDEVPHGLDDVRLLLGGHLVTFEDLFQLVAQLELPHGLDRHVLGDEGQDPGAGQDEDGLEDLGDGHAHLSEDVLEHHGDGGVAQHLQGEDEEHQEEGPEEEDLDDVGDAALGFLSAVGERIEAEGLAEALVEVARDEDLPDHLGGDLGEDVPDDEDHHREEQPDHPGGPGPHVVHHGLRHGFHWFLLNRPCRGRV